MPNTMTQLRDIEGYIVDPEAWDPDIARQLAAEEDLELSENYWQILDFMRDYWQEHRVAPDVRHVVDYLVSEQGYDKKGAKKHLFDLFTFRSPDR
jgi:TusE/DsrC/DsvC family sulfur relay protein